MPELVAEVLGHGQATQRDALAGSRRLVHLAEHQRGVLENARLFHFEVEIVALAGALTHAAEHRVATVLLGDRVDELHDDDRLADAGATEQTDLSTLGVGREEIDDLDAGLEDLAGAGLLLERRRLAVDRHALVAVA